MKRLLFILGSIVLSFKISAQDLLVLGVAQDAGYPQMGCKEECCAKAWKNDSLRRFVVSLALVDPVSKKWWLFEASPDIKEQLQLFKTLTKGEYGFLPDGIFITHAHIGHYTGLMQLGREVMNAKELPVYCLPKMRSYLANNGPWSQLVDLQNISLKDLKADSLIRLSPNTTIMTFTVPHRDEYSETAGFRIYHAKSKYLFIPDIDKWQKWNRDIVKEVQACNFAFIDATFNVVSELKNRKMEEVPHPFTGETMELFRTESKETKSRIHFIHFNHTNLIMHDKSAKEKILQQGFKIAEQGAKY